MHVDCSSLAGVCKGFLIIATWFKEQQFKKKINDVIIYDNAVHNNPFYTFLSHENSL